MLAPLYMGDDYIKQRTDAGKLIHEDDPFAMSSRIDMFQPLMDAFPMFPGIHGPLVSIFLLSVMLPFLTSEFGPDRSEEHRDDPDDELERIAGYVVHQSFSGSGPATTMIVSSTSGCTFGS